ncbi:MAG: LysR family transcriptional regulator [Mycobacteriaceae bacterium]|nr:LysR family transcriptional regulator [Mycobacteriaceae bacterium]
MSRLESDGSVLRVGFVPGVTVTKWERVWAERFPDIRLELIPLPMAAQSASLREGAVDMCFVRAPFDRDGMHAIALYRETPVVVVPKDHPVAAFATVAEGDFADEIRQDTMDLDAAAGAIELVAAGVGVAVVPHSIARLHHRRDVVYREVTDVPDTEIALVWPVDATSDTTEEFVGVVRGRTANSSRSPANRAAPKAGKPAKPAKPAKPDKPRKKAPARRRGR